MICQFIKDKLTHLS